MSLCGSGAWACVCLQQNLQVAFQPQDLQGRYAECGGMLTEAHKEVRTLGRRAPVSTGPVTCYTYTVPLESRDNCRGDVTPGRSWGPQKRGCLLWTG
ncbi:huntingtin-associated protein 1-like isoform X3 [Mustela putorius furo]|uniref:Huntingtin-associated protein 1-like isoform X3 n=1 Tax=Mustela putorius furo TaxID=9669 RepID=A0A8U0V3X1_MUSPF|nr:huntingtin-associated protein 1-like isoform X3 [Mustela putorius furo]